MMTSIVQTFTRSRNFFITSNNKFEIRSTTKTFEFRINISMYLFVRSINKTISTIIKNSIIENLSFTFIHSYEFFFFDLKNDNFSSRISISTIDEQISLIEKNDKKLNQSKQSNFQKFSIFDEFSNFEKKKKNIEKNSNVQKFSNDNVFVRVNTNLKKKN